jgi:hypothetical protein
MSDKELNLPDYIDFAYNRFIMTRVEYLIFTQSEQEAKILRIIEWCIENERGRLYREAKTRAAQGQKVDIPDIVWVAISHSFFLSQLQGTVQSETTLKDVLSSLQKKHFIFKERGGSGPYDPPIYTINKHLLAKLTQLLPPRLDDLDMIAIMKKEREVKRPREGQKLTPSIIDPLVLKIRETIIDPPDPQLLTLYQPKIDPLSSTTGGQKLTPIIYKENSKEKNKESNIPDAATQASTPTVSSLSDEELLAEVQRRNLPTSVKGVPPSSEGVPLSTTTGGGNATLAGASDSYNPGGGSDTLNLANTRQNVLTDPPHGDALSISTHQNGSTNAPPLTKPVRKRGAPKAEQPATKLEPPQMPPTDMAWGTHKCMMLFDYWRGAVLIGHYKITQASTCAKGLAAQYTEQEVTQVYKAMNEQAYWKERGGADVCNVASNISKEMRKIKPASTPPPKPEARKALTQAEAEQLALKAVRLAQEHNRDIGVQAIQGRTGRWGIEVRWKTKYFDDPVKFATEEKFMGMFTGMCDVWASEDKERVLQ